MLKGAIHIHSTYSDGEFTLSELREELIAAGCSFACMTDHAEYFDDNRLRDYVQECEALSDDRFRFVPGLEFGCDQRMHVLGYGVTALTDTTNPQEVFRHIEASGGISVIAHPMDSMFEWIESFEELPLGIETWNSKYDGQYAPRPATFRLLGRLQERKPQMLAYYGIDFHWKKQFRGLLNEVDCDTNERDLLLAALAGGRYQARRSDVLLASSGCLSPELSDRFEAIQKRSSRLRQLTRKAKRLTARTGLKLPNAVKANLRRIF